MRIAPRGCVTCTPSRQTPANPRRRCWWICALSSTRWPPSG